MDPFAYFSPIEFVYGPGRASEIGARLSGRQIERVLIVTDPGIVGAGLVDRVAAHLDEAGIAHRIQSRAPYFTLKDAKRILAMVHQGTGLEGSIYAGLETLTRQLLARQFRRDDGRAHAD